MHKFKWFDADFGVSLATLSEKLAKMRFKNSDSDSEGVRLEIRKPGIVGGQYIEKESFIQKIVLPTGEEYEEPRSNVTITDFLLRSGDRLALQLNNPPRRTLPFLNALSEASGYEFSYTQLEVNLFKWLNSLESIFGKVDVLYLDCNGVQLSSQTTGRFAFKGSSDVRAEAARFLSKKTCYVENARCMLTTEMGIIPIELFRTGAVKASVSPQSEIVSKLRLSLLDACA